MNTMGIMSYPKPYLGPGALHSEYFGQDCLAPVARPGAEVLSSSPCLSGRGR
jgi:hypothetical protein